MSVRPKISAIRPCERKTPNRSACVTRSGRVRTRPFVILDIRA